MLQQHEKDLKWLLGQAHSPPFVLAQLSGTKVELKLFKAEYALARLDFHGRPRSFRDCSTTSPESALLFYVFNGGSPNRSLLLIG